MRGRLPFWNGAPPARASSTLRSSSACSPDGRGSATEDGPSRSASDKLSCSTQNEARLSSGVARSKSVIFDDGRRKCIKLGKFTKNNILHSAFSILHLEEPRAAGV